MFAQQSLSNRDGFCFTRILVKRGFLEKEAYKTRFSIIKFYFCQELEIYC